MLRDGITDWVKTELPNKIVWAMEVNILKTEINYRN